LANTPADPSYPGAHSVISAAGATVLRAAFGDRSAFTLGSEALPGVTRSFPSFSATVEEAGRSRIYAGVHTSLDDDAGRALGASVAAYVLEHTPTG
jgi:membrane-associated phospholipid phosphatase